LYQCAHTRVTAFRKVLHAYVFFGLPLALKEYLAVMVDVTLPNGVTLPDGAPINTQAQADALN